MDTLVHSAQLALADGRAVLETEHSTCYHLPPSGAEPADADLVFALADGTRFAYAPRGAPGGAHEAQVDAFLRGNAFRPMHDSPRVLAATLSIAAGRRMETGPESERLFLFLRGVGLVFLENGDTVKFEPGSVVAVTPGAGARVWAQGPEDALAVVMQPRGAEAPRRTLAGEVARRRHQTGGAASSAPGGA